MHGLDMGFVHFIMKITMSLFIIYTVLIIFVRFSP